ncbi:MAG: hypothetical protein ABEJ85_06365 [Haloarculaceae archaeon]
MRVEGVAVVVGTLLLVASGVAVAASGGLFADGTDRHSDGAVPKSLSKIGSDRLFVEDAAEKPVTDVDAGGTTQFPWDEERPVAGGNDSVPAGGTNDTGDAGVGTSRGFEVLFGDSGTMSVPNGTVAQSDDGTDTDDDGLTDRVERRLGTDPADRDSDADRLNDGLELAVGTDPTDRDSDDDTLRDGWEYYGRTPSGAVLPNSDPLAKDIYVQVGYASAAGDPSEEFYDRVRAAFARMPVRNPDNTTGIDLHVREGGKLNGTVAFTGDNFWRLKAQHYRKRLGPRTGTYHYLAFVDFDAKGVGYGAIGGDFAIVAQGLQTNTKKNVVVHEILHNVVGRIEAPGACKNDPAHYCGGGWLRHHLRHPEDEYLPEPIAAQLETDGFVD